VIINREEEAEICSAV